MKQVVRAAIISDFLLLALLSAASAHPVCNDPDRANIYVGQWIEALMLAKCDLDQLHKMGEMGCAEMLEPLERVRAAAEQRFDIEDPNYPDRKQIEEYCEILDEERAKHPF